MPFFEDEDGNDLSLMARRKKRVTAFGEESFWETEYEAYGYVVRINKWGSVGCVPAFIYHNEELIEMATLGDKYISYYVKSTGRTIHSEGNYRHVMNLIEQELPPAEEKGECK